MTLGQKQMQLLNSLIEGVVAARGNDIDPSEMQRIADWLDLLVKGLAAATLVRDGAAVMYWNPDADEPSFTLTSKGMKDCNISDADEAPVLN